MSIVGRGLIGAAAENGYTRTYWFYAADTATASTPITHSANSTTTFLTNNGLGSLTSLYNPSSKANLWDASSNTFDFSSLKLGDIVDFRIDLFIDHAAAQEINLVFDLAEGSALAYTRNISHRYYKTASNGVIVTAHFKLPMISQETLDNSGRIRFTSIAAASIVVEGWLSQVTDV
jgi:hypothetical protein